MKIYNRKKISRPTDDRADFLPTASELYEEYLKAEEARDNEINESAKRIFSSPEYLALNFPDGYPDLPDYPDDIAEPGAITPTGLYVPKG